MSELWLEKHAPGFRDLPEADRRAIFGFSFLWSLFEARVMENFARADRIRQRVDEWAVAGTLRTERFGKELAYFRARYCVNGALTHDFFDLNLRAKDHPKLVEAVICGIDDDSRNRMLVLLMIVWRLRNNLFHGEKWSYGIAGQLDNFTHANAVLMELLESHGKLA